MRKHKIACLLLGFFCLLWSYIPVNAAQSGSLKIINVEEPVCLYHVADLEGNLTEAFQDAPVEDLADEKKMVENASILLQYICDRDIPGWEETVGESGQILFSPLEENLYFVRSMADEGEFAPFLITIPTMVNGSLIYNVQAEPKEETPTEPTEPTIPTEPEPEPEIPQTGSSILPQYLLLTAGALLIAVGIGDLIRGREREV